MAAVAYVSVSLSIERVGDRYRFFRNFRFEKDNGEIEEQKLDSSVGSGWSSISEINKNWLESQVSLLKARYKQMKAIKVIFDENIKIIN